GNVFTANPNGHQTYLILNDAAGMSTTLNGLLGQQPGAPGPSVTGAPANVATGGTSTASWQGVQSPTTTDWVGLYRQGAADTSITNWKFTSSCTTTAGSTAKALGSCSFTMPGPAGTYEYRLFKNNGYTKLATSAPFTVGIVADTTPPVISAVAAGSI